MKKVVSGILAVGILSVAGNAFAHVHTTESSGQELANGANHPGFTEESTGYYVSTGFDAYVEEQVVQEDGSLDRSANSANSGYGLETAHHGPDQSTPGKADDEYAGYGTKGGKSPADSNPGIK